MSLVVKIRGLCKARKLTVAELERRTGISNGQIRKWDISTPGADKVKLVADFFDVSVDYLLGRTDDPHIETIAAHHDGEDWTEEELDEIERFKEFVRMKRKGRE